MSGAVRVEGSVLSGGCIQFLPKGGGKPAFGEIGSDGSFQLMTFQPQDGALPGTYWLSVIPADQGSAAPGAAKGAGATGDVRVVYRGPEEPLVEIAAEGDISLAIDIRAADGWRAVRDD